MHLRGSGGKRVERLAHLPVENRNVLFDVALTRLLLGLLLPLHSLEPARRDSVLLEDLQGSGQPADLIGTIGALDQDVEITLGKLRHLAGHMGERSGYL